MNELRWTIVIPLKSAPGAKSRLAHWLEPGRRLALVRAMVADTVAAAAAAGRVEGIVVVTGDAAMARTARRAVASAARRAVGSAVVDVVDEPEPAGLNAAVRAGIEWARRARPTHGVGVLLGDLPALRPAELDDALAQAGRHSLGVVTDAHGTGTTLLTATPGAAVDPAFGPGSALLHRSRGHVRLVVPPGSGLAHDVDVPADLEVVLALGVGVRTRRALRGVSLLRAV